MHPDNAAWIREFMRLSYRGYYKAVDKDPSVRLNLPIKSAAPPRDGLIHASALDKCPKKAAMEALGLAKWDPPFEARQRMEVGTQMGHVFYESLVWGAKDKAVILRDEEYLITNDPTLPIAGRPDVSLIYKGKLLPVEVKTTNAWKYDGITKGYMLQCICYMKLMEQRYRGGTSADYGFIVTIYDSLEAPEPFHIWTIRKDSDRYNLVDDHDNPILIEALPGNGYQTFITDADFRYTVEERVEWMKAVKAGESLIDVAPFPTPFASWDCGRGKMPERYVKTGELKPTTGYWHVGCPAFALCWRSQLRQAGLDPDSPLPKPLLLDGPAQERQPDKSDVFFRAGQDQSF